MNLTEPKDTLAVLNLKFENLSDEAKEKARAKIKLLKQVENILKQDLALLVL